MSSGDRLDGSIILGIWVQKRMLVWTNTTAIVLKRQTFPLPDGRGSEAQG